MVKKDSFLLDAGLGIVGAIMTAIIFSLAKRLRKVQIVPDKKDQKKALTTLERESNPKKRMEDIVDKYNKLNKEYICLESKIAMPIVLNHMDKFLSLANNPVTTKKYNFVVELIKTDPKLNVYNVIRIFLIDLVNNEVFDYKKYGEMLCKAFKCKDGYSSSEKNQKYTDTIAAAANDELIKLLEKGIIYN